MPTIREKARQRVKKLTKAECERRSINIRKELGLTPTAPLCAFDLADHLDIPLATIHDVNLNAKEILHFQDEDKGKRFDAVSLQLGENGERLIIYNPFHSDKRTQTTLMHEIAHVLLEHDVSNPKLDGISSIWLPHLDKRQEEEAEMLGWALKLPRECILRELRKEKSIEEISEAYNATTDLVKARINTTGAKRQILAERKKYPGRFKR